MERRTFLKSTSALFSAGFLGFTAHAQEQKNNTHADQMTQRLSVAALRKLKISFPSMVVITPTGETVEIQLKPRIIRRYAHSIYVYFEQVKEISIFTLQGESAGKIHLPDSMESIKDFAIDHTLQSVHILEYGKHSITTLDFYGQTVASIGEFGTELMQDLNGPKSLTVDEQSNIHVLTGNDNIIRVYAANGVYVSSYNHIGRNIGHIRQIDGYKVISGVGGKFNDKVTVLSGH